MLEIDISPHILVSIQNFETEFPDVCFLEKQEEIPPKQKKPVTISPAGLAVTLTVPPGTIPFHPNKPAIVALKTCVSAPLFTYPEGCTPLSAVYHVSATSCFKKEVELTFEHFAKLETEGHNKKVIVLRAKSSPTVVDGKKKFIFERVDADDFAVGEGHCKISTTEFGFICAGASQTDDLRKFFCIDCIYVEYWLIGTHL